MSREENKSFWDEIQEKYEIGRVEYTPAYYLNAGVILTFKLANKNIRPNCPICCERPNIHEYIPKTLNFGTVNGTPMHIELNHCRYRCKSCGCDFMEEFEYLPDFRSLSKDADNYIISKLGSQTFTEIANELGICVQTVANRAKEFGELEKKLQLAGKYSYLSMDEVFISRNDKGEALYYWVLNDISTSWKSNNIRIDAGRNKEDVIKRLLELEHPEKVIAVSIDMWKPYRDAISAALPNAAIVIDPFHLVKLAYSAVDKVRKRADLDKSLKAQMKKDAGLFLTSLFKLCDEELARLESYLKASPELEKAYFIAQELSGFYCLHDYEYALHYLSLWESDVLESGIPEMLDIHNTVINWLPYIMNYFIYRITNGRTEGRNHLLRVIDRLGFHYGLDSLQACIYAHDRKQEYLKWKKYQRRKFKEDSSAA